LPINCKEKKCKANNISEKKEKEGERLNKNKALASFITLFIVF